VLSYKYLTCTETVVEPGSLAADIGAEGIHGEEIREETSARSARIRQGVCRLRCYACVQSHELEFEGDKQGRIFWQVQGGGG